MANIFFSYGTESKKKKKDKSGSQKKMKNSKATNIFVDMYSIITWRPVII